MLTIQPIQPVVVAKDPLTQDMVFFRWEREKTPLSISTNPYRNFLWFFPRGRIAQEIKTAAAAAQTAGIGARKPPFPVRRFPSHARISTPAAVKDTGSSGRSLTSDAVVKHPSIPAIAVIPTLEIRAAESSIPPLAVRYARIEMKASAVIADTDIPIKTGFHFSFPPLFFEIRILFICRPPFPSIVFRSARYMPTVGVQREKGSRS